MTCRRVTVTLASFVAILVGLTDAARAQFQFLQVAGTGFDPITAQGLDLPFGSGILSFEVPFTRLTGGAGSGPYLEQTGHPSVDTDGTMYVLAALDTLDDCTTCGRAVTSQVQLDFYDFVVTRTDGTPGGSVPARVNFELDAALDAWARSSGIHVTASLMVNARGPGGLADSDQLRLDACKWDSVEVCSSVHGDGIFAPYDVPLSGTDDVLSVDVALDAQSSSFNAPIGTAFGIGFTVLANVEVNPLVSPLGAFPYGKATVDARPPGPPSPEQGLRFARTRPVLELPAGYTVNAPSAFVVDNHFVPEPPHSLGAASALAVLALLAARAPRRR
jgi:hypothetical protein